MLLRSGLHFDVLLSDLILLQVFCFPGVLIPVGFWAVLLVSVWI